MEYRYMENISCEGYEIYNEINEDNINDVLNEILKTEW